MVMEHATEEPRKKKGRSFMKWLMWVVLIAIVIVVIYFIFSSPSQKPNWNIYLNLNNTNLTEQQHLFYSDLAKVFNITGVKATYSLTNAGTAQLNATSNATVTITQNMNITSYLFENQTRSDVNQVTVVKNNYGTVLNRNVSSVYSYTDTNATITCINSTDYYAGSSNSSFGCSSGYHGLQLTLFPFALDNLTYFGYLGDIM